MDSIVMQCLLELVVDRQFQIKSVRNTDIYGMSFALQRLKQKLPLTSWWERRIDRVGKYVSPPSSREFSFCLRGSVPRHQKKKKSIESSNRQQW